MSRFVQEIPKEAMEFTGGGDPGSSSLSYRDRMATWTSPSVSSARAVAGEFKTAPQPQPKDGAAGKYYRGAVVRHAKFGLGTVQRSEGAGDDLKISVSFPGHGVKTLAVKYANLEVI